LAKVATLNDLAMDVAIDAAKSAGEILLKHYREGMYRTAWKQDTSLQTTADLESEKEIIDKILSRFPGHSIESEERGPVSTSSSYKWLIDPLDGTENFVLGIPYFSSSIALCEEGKPIIAVVYNPVSDDLYTAKEGDGAFLNGRRIYVSNEVELKRARACFIPDFATKRMRQTACLRDKLYYECRRVLDTWSPALDWCLVANGKADFVVSVAGNPLHPDAGTLILEEAGGKITDFENRTFEYKNTGCIVGSNSLLHDQLLQLVSEHYT